MTYKVYLVKHLDTGMGYVGVTSRELSVRWKQHQTDTTSAIYNILKTDSHRMTMELLECFENRDQAFDAEQKYITELRTGHPNGWNRQVRILNQPSDGYIPKVIPVHFSTDDGSLLVCPICEDDRLLQRGRPRVFRRSILQYFVCPTCHKYEKVTSARGRVEDKITPLPFELSISLHDETWGFRIAMLVFTKGDIK